TTISQDDPYWRTQAFITSGLGTPIGPTLPTLRGVNAQFPAGYGYAKGVNAAGWVVGQSLSDPSEAAPGRAGRQESYGCLWKKNPSGQYESMPLHKLTTDPNWVFDIATCVNGSNSIGATGFIQLPNGQTVSAFHSATLLILSGSRPELKPHD